MDRISELDYYFDIVNTVAKRSTCVRRKVGAIIVRDKTILTTGYNGAPRHLNHCTDIGCIREQNKIKSGTRQEMCMAIHAEQNAIIQAAKTGVNIFGATLYVNTAPCIICSKMIINAGIRKVVFESNYSESMGLELFQRAGIKYTQHKRREQC